MYELVLKERLFNMRYINSIKALVLMIGIALLVTNCKSNNDGNITEKELVPLQVITSQEISVPVYDFQAFSPMLDYNNDTLYIFNFWATWCKPCVKELPFFNMADSAYADKPVRIVLISLDFVENVEDILIPFIIEHEVRAEVILLDDMDANSWIPRVDPDWEGAIPATLFKQKSNRKFVVQSFTYDELVNDIESFLNP